MGRQAPVSPRVVFVYGDPYDVYVGRGRCPITGKPGIYGNPYSHKEGTMAAFRVASVEEAVDRFWKYVLVRPELVAKIRRELKGKTLGCWCKTVKNPNALCHGDVLLRIANAEGCVSDCCERGGLLNHSDNGPAIFRCPKGCVCHE